MRDDRSTVGRPCKEVRSTVQDQFFGGAKADIDQVAVADGHTDNDEPGKVKIWCRSNPISAANVLASPLG
jgi:hypothetical protein